MFNLNLFINPFELPKVYFYEISLVTVRDFKLSKFIFNKKYLNYFRKVISHFFKD